LPAPPNLVGANLAATDFAALESRWVDRQMAESAYLRRVDSWIGRSWLDGRAAITRALPSLTLLPVIGMSVNTDCDGIIPISKPIQRAAEGQAKISKSARPQQHALLAARLRRHAARKCGVALIITEGEVKTLALGHLAKFGVQSHPRFLPVGISGVFNWRGTVGKATALDGQRLNVKGPILDLD
jgi:hypothetical protein